jgi:hypothetical protein
VNVSSTRGKTDGGGGKKDVRSIQSTTRHVWLRERCRVVRPLRIRSGSRNEDGAVRLSVRKVRDLAEAAVMREEGEVHSCGGRDR